MVYVCDGSVDIGCVFGLYCGCFSGVCGWCVGVGLGLVNLLFGVWSLFVVGLFVLVCVCRI